MFQALFGIITRQRTIETSEMSVSATSWFTDRFKWCPTSIAALEAAEKKVLSYLKRPFTTKYIEITSDKQEEVWRIRTLVMNEDETRKNAPLVMLHGLGSAIGLWVLNLDALSKDRALYAIDVLGFGLSSRPSFGNDPIEVEEILVKSLESWREKVGLEKFILLGHSMGGFLATAYAMSYPQHIYHLMLADPWGFPERDKTIKKVQLPFWARIISKVLQHFNPFVMLRAAGPWGPHLIERTRPDILQKFANVMKDPNDIGSYIYHCNAQTPSGEVAFKSMSCGFGWAKHPMIPRIETLCEDVPITFLYGSHSWMDRQSGYIVKQQRQTSKVEIKLIQDSGHHVNADQPELFHSFVEEVCDEADELAHKKETFQTGKPMQIDTKDYDSFHDRDIESIPGTSSIP